MPSSLPRCWPCWPAAFRPGGCRAFGQRRFYALSEHIAVNGDDVVIAESLAKHFSSGPEEVLAVDNVSFRLPRGKMIALRGSSGTGKSTLLNLLGALDRPTSGELLVDNVNVGTLAGQGEVDYRRRKVGFVFQSFNLI